MIKPLIVPPPRRHAPAKSPGLLQHRDIGAFRLKATRQQDPGNTRPNNNDLLPVHDQSAGGITQKIGRPTLP